MCTSVSFCLPSWGADQTLLSLSSSCGSCLLFEILEDCPLSEIIRELGAAGARGSGAVNLVVFSVRDVSGLCLSFT